jgi:hypothetical protein
MTLPDARTASGWKDEGDELFEKGHNLTYK